MKIQSSCEIEYFVKTHLCKLCVILRSRVLRVVYFLQFQGKYAEAGAIMVAIGEKIETTGKYDQERLASSLIDRASILSCQVRSVILDMP